MKNIALVGMMGAGKTTVGQALADFLCWQFVDIDKEIEIRENCKISEIFAKKGEKYFRDLETLVLQDNSTSKGRVISTGGGAFESEQNREILQKCSTVYLKASVGVLFDRIEKDDTRPLLQTENPRKTLENLLKIREKNYEKADIIVDTEGKSPLGIVEEINAKSRT